MQRRPLVGILAALVFTAACDVFSPAAPSQYADVAGTYAGSVTMRWSVAGQSESLPGSMEMRVTQSGALITVARSVTLAGETETWPGFSGTIDETGVVTITGEQLQSAGPGTDSGECGSVTGHARTLSFSGDTARHTETTTTENCGTFELNGTLTR